MQVAENDNYSEFLLSFSNLIAKSFKADFFVLIMCKDCCVEVFVDRGETVHESGSYLVNFKRCKECGVRSMITIKNKEINGDEDIDNETEITFDHHCSRCGHKICQHFYSYELDDGYHKYLMECQLCGRGAHEQFAGIKQVYDQNLLNQLGINTNYQTNDNSTNDNNDETKDDEKESEHKAKANIDKDGNKKIVLNLSAMKQLNIENMSDNDDKSGNKNNEVAEDEWDD